MKHQKSLYTLSIEYGKAVGNGYEISMRELWLDAWHEWVGRM